MFEYRPQTYRMVLTSPLGGRRGGQMRRIRGSKSCARRKRKYARACAFLDIEPKRQLRASRSYKESPRGFFPLCRPSGNAECSYASNPTKETKRKGARLDSFSFCAHSTKMQLLFIPLA